MSNTINIGGIQVSKFYLGGSSDVKIYLGSTKLYPHLQEPCFAVVDNISTYTARTYVDVYETSSDKWYKLNNLGSYEEYGVYGSSTATTYYDGKLVIQDGYEYQYSGSGWNNVGEVTGSTATLPDVSFVLNYNAKDYDSSTTSIPYTEGQLNTVNAVKQYGAAVVDHSEDGYISVTGDTRFVTTGGTVGIGRNNTQTGCTMTIVSKARATSGEAVLTSRGGSGGSQMNWMWRYRTDGIFLHGSSSYSSKQYSVDTTVNPIIASVKTYYDGGVKQILKDWTNDGGYSGNFGYGSYYDGGSMFCDYLSYNSEFWQGDFYWVYMTQDVLTDEQIQQVIAYNESGGQAVYPVYYDEMQDPPNYLSFSSMTEAEEYECPWVGMKATIAGSGYTFNSNYEWEYIPSRLPVGYTEVQYIENFSNTSDTYTALAYISTNFYPTENTRTIADIKVMRATMNPRYFGSGNWNALGYIVSQEWTIGEDRARIYCKYGNSSSWIQTDYIPTMDRHVYDHNNNGKLLIDNVDIVSLPTTSFTCTRPMAIFTAIQNSGNVDLGEAIYGRLYSFKVYENGVLVRDLVPCTRDSDSKVGVYDIVNDVFYQSANSNSLIAGPTV